MSENLHLGKVNPPRHERDAIHIAVIQMIVGSDGLSPGSHVAIKAGTTDTIVERDKCYGENGQIGIVDPFITEYWLKVGQRVWVYLYPNTVTGLRHNWEHPAFTGLEEKISNMNESELWLRNFADEWGFNYQDMIDEAKAGHGYITALGNDLHGRYELGGDYDLFWHHIEKLTGNQYDEHHRDSVGWSCSC